MTRQAWFYFGAVSLLWGVPYFFIKIALHDLSPSDIAWARVIIGALILAPLAFRGGALRRLRHRAGILFFLGAIEIAAPFLLIGSGEQRISSSLTGILIATEPLFIALLALWLDSSERVSLRQLGGMLVGLAGVAVLLGFDLHGRQALVGSGMILMATMCYAVGALVVKRYFADVSPISVVMAALVVSAVVLAGPALASAPHVAPNRTSIVALLVLGVACTGLGFIAFFTLIGLVGAGRATIITYVSPAVAILLGVALRGEPWTVSTTVGLILILAGSWFGTQLSRAPA